MPARQNTDQILTVPRRRRSWRRKAILASAAVALVAGAVALLTGEDEPTDTARAFLEAVRAKDLDRAYELAEGDRHETVDPTDRTQFVDQKALRGDWQVGEVTETSRRDNHGWEEVFVRYELIGPNKLRGQGSLKVYRGQQHPETWIVAYPLVTVDVKRSALRYLDVNAVHVARDLSYYNLLPGLYEFYARDSSPYVKEKGSLRFVTGRAERHTSITVEHGGTFDDAIWPTVEAAATAIVQSCAQQAVLAPPNCPLGFSVPVIPYGETEPLTEVEDVEWTVRQLPPVVHAVAPNLQDFDSMPVLFDLDPYEPSGIELAATGRTPDGERVPFTAECGIKPGVLVWGIEPNGEVVVEDSDPSATNTVMSCQLARLA